MWVCDGTYGLRIEHWYVLAGTLGVRVCDVNDDHAMMGGYAGLAGMVEVASYNCRRGYKRFHHEEI